MAAGRKPFSGHGDDPCLYSGKRRGKLNIVRDITVQSAALLRFILPGDPEQVQRIHIPQAGLLQSFLHFLRRMLRMDHLIDGRDQDPVLLRLPDIMRKCIPFDSKINLYHDSYSFPIHIRIYIE